MEEYNENKPRQNNAESLHFCKYIMMGDYSLLSGVFIWKKTSKTHKSEETNNEKKAN